MQSVWQKDAVGVAKGHEAKDISYDYLLTTFVPLLRKAGVTDEQVRVLLEVNPQRVLTFGTSTAAEKESVVAAEQK
jgi:phosphotriesterase-related protein